MYITFKSIVDYLLEKKKEKKYITGMIGTEYEDEFVVKNFLRAPKQIALSGSVKILECHNVVATVRYGIQLDAFKIMRIFPSSAYKMKRFKAVILRFSPPNVVILLFNKGSAVFCGINSVPAAKYTIHWFRMELMKHGFQPTISRLSIENMVLGGSVGHPVKIEEVEYEDNMGSVYLPNTFPGLVYTMYNPRVNMLIFKTGKFMILGAKEFSDALKSSEHIIRILGKYQTPIGHGSVDITSAVTDEEGEGESGYPKNGYGTSKYRQHKGADLESGYRKIIEATEGRYNPIEIQNLMNVKFTRKEKIRLCESTRDLYSLIDIKKRFEQTAKQLLQERAQKVEQKRSKKQEKLAASVPKPLDSTDVGSVNKNASIGPASIMSVDSNQDPLAGDMEGTASVPKSKGELKAARKILRDLGLDDLLADSDDEDNPVGDFHSNRNENTKHNVRAKKTNASNSAENVSKRRKLSTNFHDSEKPLGELQSMPILD